MKNTFSLYVLLLGIKIAFTSNENIKLNHFSFKFNFTKSNGHKTTNYSEIPLDIVMKLNKTSDLKLKNSVIVPKSAHCALETHTIDLKNEDQMIDNQDINLRYLPSCTRVKRCGGCCDIDGRSCQPDGPTKTLYFQVSVLKFDEVWMVKEKKIISVEQHVKCKCNCNIKKEDCLKSQEYNDTQCICTCKNLVEQQICEKEPEIKIWDGRTCSCECIVVEDCTSGLEFDYNTCSCQPRDTYQ